MAASLPRLSLGAGGLRRATTFSPRFPLPRAARGPIVGRPGRGDARTPGQAEGTMHRATHIIISACVALTGCGSGGSPKGGAPASAPGSLERSAVPEALRLLIPQAEKWGVGDDVERGELIEGSSAEDRQALRKALEPHQSAITDWLDSFGEGAMTHEAAAFMYMQLAVAEMP